MKDHITVEQLSELSESQRERLRAWWEPQPGQWIAFDEREHLLVGIDDQDTSQLWMDRTRPTITHGLGGETHENQYAIGIVGGTNDEYAEYHPNHRIVEVQPLLSIAQMLNFLSDGPIWEALERIEFREDRHNPEYGHEGPHWCITLDDDMIGAHWRCKGCGGDRWDIPRIHKKSNEPCDALWEAVKEVLRYAEEKNLDAYWAGSRS